MRKSEKFVRSGAKICKSCRSHQALSNEYFLAKIGADTAENEPRQFCRTGRARSARWARSHPRSSGTPRWAALLTEFVTQADENKLTSI